MTDKRATVIDTPERAASVVAVTIAGGAVACGVCCVLPFAFPAVAAAGAGSTLAWFAAAQGWAMQLATVIVAGAWISVGIRTRRTRLMPARATLYWMALATAALVLAVVWPRIEPQLIRILTGN